MSGNKYSDFIQHHILEPAGMTHSGFFDRAHLPLKVARSYDEAQDATAMHPRQGSSAGGLQASAGDLFRLVQAIDNGKLIKPDSIRILRSLIPKPPNAPSPVESDRLVGYGIQGGAPGVSAQLAIDPSGRYTRVVLCNGTPPMAQSMAVSIRDWIEQMPK